jgi:hypothetical protein
MSTEPLSALDDEAGGDAQVDRERRQSPARPALVRGLHAYRLCPLRRLTARKRLPIKKFRLPD